MSDPTEFMGLALDEQVLQTPDGDMPLGDITRAEFVREIAVDGHGPSTQETSIPAVAGGAIVGGALLGPAGALGGALLGSTYKKESPGAPHVRTLSAKLVFETEDAEFSMDVPLEREVAAIWFAKKVRKAAKTHSG